MRVESQAAAFLAKVESRVEASVEDLVPAARRNLGGGGQLSGSVRVIQVGPLRWVVGSDHPGARAQELGAWITPRERKALKFNGRFSAHARIPAKRWLSQAAGRWPAFLRSRLAGR